MSHSHLLPQWDPETNTVLLPTCTRPIERRGTVPSVQSNRKRPFSSVADNVRHDEHEQYSKSKRAKTHPRFANGYSANTPIWTIVEFSETDESNQCLCWHDHHPFDKSKTVRLPLHALDDGTVAGFGTFCSWECAMGYATERSLLSDDQWKLFRSVVQAHKLNPEHIHPAPPAYMIRSLGGPFTIEQFRSCTIPPTHIHVHYAPSPVFIQIYQNQLQPSAISSSHYHLSNVPFGEKLVCLGSRQISRSTSEPAGPQWRFVDDKDHPNIVRIFSENSGPILLRPRAIHQHRSQSDPSTHTVAIEEGIVVTEDDLATSAKLQSVPSAPPSVIDSHTMTIPHLLTCPPPKDAFPTRPYVSRRNTTGVNDPSINRKPRGNKYTSSLKSSSELGQELQPNE